MHGRFWEWLVALIPPSSALGSFEWAPKVSWNRQCRNLPQHLKHAAFHVYLVLYFFVYLSLFMVLKDKKDTLDGYRQNMER